MLGIVLFRLVGSLSGFMLVCIGFSQIFICSFSITTTGSGTPPIFNSSNQKHTSQHTDSITHNNSNS